MLQELSFGDLILVSKISCQKQDFMGYIIICPNEYSLIGTQVLIKYYLLNFFHFDYV